MSNDNGFKSDELKERGYEFYRKVVNIHEVERPLIVNQVEVIENTTSIIYVSSINGTFVEQIIFDEGQGWFEDRGDDMAYPVDCDYINQITKECTYWIKPNGEVVEVASS